MVTLLLSSCTFIWQEPERGSVTAVNETSETLEFKVFGDGEWLDLPTSLPPGRDGAILYGTDLVEPSRLTVDGCTEGDVVAYGPDDREVARHPPPLCDGDNWIIMEEAQEP
ncbi:MAG TPA: hypothetical protein VJ820_20865 [Propionibacteriaceae bacterium]|nr:hypothetical protein [Propionibacteriaceae bacterium]